MSHKLEQLARRKKKASVHHLTYHDSCYLLGSCDWWRACEEARRRWNLQPSFCSSRLR